MTSTRSVTFTASHRGDPAAVRDRDRRYVWHTWSPIGADRSELTFSHGSGAYLWDIDGREYLDASSLNSSCGYGNREVAEAIGEQAGRLHYNDLSTTSNAPAGELAERLATILPTGMDRTLFVNSGSEAIDAAILTACAHHSHLGRPRSRVVGFSRGYHGATLLSRSVSRLPRNGHALAGQPKPTLVELPAEPRELRNGSSLADLLKAFERAIEIGGPETCSAVVVEPFLNVGGGVVLPPGFLHGLRELCNQAGALLIVDEVFTAYARTGRMFACDREQVTPDLLVTSKGLAGGYIPIASMSAHDRVYQGFVDEPVVGGIRYGHTTSGHPVACAAALTTLDLIERDCLAERADRLGDSMLRRLQGLISRPRVTDVRGLGLILVVEMADEAAALDIITAARAHGLLLRRQGRAVMVIPPLIVDEQIAMTIVQRVEWAFDS